jgi:SNF2 family DNA or RNA helicase
VELYPFQTEDVRKIVRQKAGLIGSEMGTGKTHVAIELDQHWFNHYQELDDPRPTLVIAPLNTHDSWVQKYKDQAPWCDVVRIDRKNRSKFIVALQKNQGDVFLMHWDALRLMPELRKVHFGTIIADEVHRASNRKAQVFRALKGLKCDHKLAMSGTATGDRPDNLWAVLNWLWPSYYTSYWKFVDHYCVREQVADPSGETNGYTKLVGVQNIASLMEEMRPFYVRHLKRERCCDHHPQGVMPWLKEKTYDTIWVDLSPTQRRFYEQMRKEMVAWVGEHEDTPLAVGVVVAQMARLSQMALATPVVVGKKWVWRVVTTPEGDKVKERVEVDDVRLIEPSSKLDAMMELLQDHPDKKFVIVSASKQAIYLAQARLTAKGIKSHALTGDTPEPERHGMVKRFAEDDSQVFLGVIEAMAEGIDGLQHATDTMVFLNRSWRTMMNKQCEDRLHRGGQKDTVQIIDIMARNTVDLGRKQKLEEKWQWIKTILGDGFNNERELAA